MKLLRNASLLFLVSITTSFIISNQASANNAIQPKLPLQKILTQFTAYTQKAQPQWQVPGVAVAIVQNGKIVYAKGFGVRNAKGQPVTANTIFDIASLTKSFTAVMLGMQIDKGKYSWNTKVISLYPGFKLYSAETTKEFEVRDLIAHDSGLPADALDTLGNFGYSTNHTLYALRYIKPAAPFRTEFAYQDIFLAVAKKIIQRTSGHSYTTDINQWIFKPLDMTRSYIRTQPELKQVKNIAQPFLLSYSLKNYPYTTSSPYISKKWALDIGLAGGGIHSTVNDIAKWLIFNINNGIYNGKRLITPKTMQFIHTPQTIITKNKSNQTTLAYGEGWFIDFQSYKPYTLYYHDGGGTGMHALMSYIPQAKLGIVVLTNNYTSNLPRVLTRWFFDMYIYGKPQKNWNEFYLQQRTAAIKQAQTAKNTDHCKPKTNANLSKYIGVYSNPVYGKLIITRKGKNLSLSIGPQNIKWILWYCKPNTLKAFWPNPNGMPVPMLAPGQDLINFKVNPNGKIETMTIPFLNNTNNGTFIKEK